MSHGSRAQSTGQACEIPGFRERFSILIFFPFFHIHERQNDPYILLRQGGEPAPRLVSPTDNKIAKSSAKLSFATLLFLDEDNVIAS